MGLKPDEILCPMCGYSKDVEPKSHSEGEPLYYCSACDYEFLQSESGKLLVQRSGEGKELEYKDIPPSVWKEAWLTLYSCFGERLQQEEIDLMDSVLDGVALDMQDEMEQFKIDNILRRFPGLVSGGPDERELSEVSLDFFNEGG